MQRERRRVVNTLVSNRHYHRVQGSQDITARRLYRQASFIRTLLESQLLRSYKITFWLRFGTFACTYLGKEKKGGRGTGFRLRLHLIKNVNAELKEGGGLTDGLTEDDETAEDEGAGRPREKGFKKETSNSARGTRLDERV